MILLEDKLIKLNGPGRVHPAPVLGPVGEPAPAGSSTGRTPRAHLAGQLRRWHAADVDDEELSAPHQDAIRCAFQFAREHGRGCGPAEFLVGISAGSGPAAAALDPGPGRSLRAVAAAAGNQAGPGGGYVHLQAQGAARSLAAARGQRTEPGHLLIALLDQRTPEVTDLLTGAGLDPASVRRAALAAIGAAADTPPVALPALAPAGSLDRPPLPSADLDARAWAVLRWRQDHLPLDRLRRTGDLQALSRLERAAAWRLAGQLRVDDDQRYSLLRQHDDQVASLAAQARPDLSRPGPGHRRRLAAGLASRRRRPPFGHVTAGWATWFGNRGVDLRDRWFQLRTARYYRGCPQP
jgi:hypothetical protein